MALNPRVLLTPHFPALVADDQAGRGGSIQAGLRELGRTFQAEGVEVMVILSAVWEEEGPFQIDSGARHKSLQDMVGVDVDFHIVCDGWPDLASALQENGLASGLPVETVHRGMDHGASVPYSFLFGESGCRVVVLSNSIRAPEQFILWGKVVRETCAGAGAECALMVGSSLSYDEAAFSRDQDLPGGVELDRIILSRLEAGDWEGLAGWPVEPGRAAPQAGLRQLAFLQGVLGETTKGRVLAFQHHPSIGSVLVEFTLPV
ncbi:MAG: hypothetical protein ACE5ID_05705 [Acidobacteriota bacterium]